jgi:glycosyltransferase involved in cell wall biosynthesis
VVISLANQPGLVDAVRSLLSQDHPAEVVVVNSGGGDAGATLRSAGLDVPLVEFERRLLPGAARNAGIDATSGRYVAFLAADCIAEPGWVSGRLRRHGQGAAAVASAVTNANPESIVARAAHLSLFASRMTGASEPGLYGASFDRALFARFGRFREDLRTGEDTEFRERLDGVPIAWAPEVRSAHRQPQRLGALLRDHLARGRRAAVSLERLRGRPYRHRLVRQGVRRAVVTARIGWRAAPGERLSQAAAWPLLLAASVAYALGAAGAPRARARLGGLRGVQRAFLQLAVPSAGPSLPRRRTRLLAILQARDEMRWLPDFIASLAPEIDGIVALDDGSTDGTAEWLAERPEVLELIRVPPERPEWDEMGNHRRLVEAALRHGAKWLLMVDADERPEPGFRVRAERVIRRGRLLGYEAYAVRLRELWDSPDTYRCDGIWGKKAVARLFRARADHQFEDRRRHAIKAPMQIRRRLGGFPLADLEIYHQRMIRPEDRVERRRKHETWDPDRTLQRIGYAYLTDETGLRLAHPDPGRGWRSWLRQDGLPYAGWVQRKLRSEARRLASPLRRGRRSTDAPTFGLGRSRGKARLRALEEENAELRRLLADSRRRQGSWARTARRIERSRTWRLGNFLVRALRLLTFRRPVPSEGPGELAAMIEGGDPTAHR